MAAYFPREELPVDGLEEDIGSACSIATSSVRQYTYTREGEGTIRGEAYNYDVYIHYHLDDHDFVKEHIINYLDSEFYGNHKSCHEIKDFLPGRNVAECIVEAMMQSFWTFIVFSKNSSKNGYANYLYKQCVKHSGLKRVLPIIIDDIEIPEALFDLNVCLDFNIVPPDEFHSRIVQCLSVNSNLIPANNRDVIQREKNQNQKRDGCNESCHFPSPSDIDGSSVNEGVTSGQARRNKDKNKDNDEPEFIRKQLDPYTDRALLIRKTPKVTKKSTSHVLDDSCKWSIEHFHDNPEVYIKKFDQTNRSSALFRQIERTLLCDILPEVPGTGESGNIHQTSLVLLACCPSTLVKKRALEILEQTLVKDDLQGPATADGLMATEDRLRASLLDEPFKSETVDFQTLRLIVYGKLLFYMAMHMEKKHLSIDGMRLSLISQIIEIVNLRLKQMRHLTYQMTYALHLVSHAHSYLVKLLQGFTSRVASDKISDQITQLGNVRDFPHFSPWHMLETMLKRNTYWIYMDIIQSFVGNLVFTDEGYLRVLLQHLSLLLQSFPDIKVQYKSGVLLGVSRILARLTVYHRTKEVRINAVMGFKTPKSSPGLKDIWVSELYKTDQEFSQAVSEIIAPLLLNASDIEVRQLIYNEFFISMYEDPTVDYHASIPVEEQNILNVVVKHLTEQYQYGGDLLTFEARPRIIRHTDIALIIEGYLNYDIHVVVKLPRNFTSFGTQYRNENNTDMLRTEVNTLKALDHENILRLLSLSFEDFVPLHFVIEYMDGGNLLDRLHAGRNTSLIRITNKCQLDMCIQVANALAFLKKEGFVHRDICAYNVLLGSVGQARGNKWNLKLSGFGLARKGNSRDRTECAENTSKYDSVLTRWSAPESLSKAVWSPQTDVWMFACLMFEIFTLGAHPFPECQEATDAHLMIERGHRLMQQHCVPSSIHLLIQDGMHQNPLKRITISKCQESLLEMRRDWAAERVGENHVVTYPDRPRKKLERISPNTFQKMHLASSRTGGMGRQRRRSTQNTKHIASRLLVTPDEINASNADQPIPIFKVQGAKVRCLINQEPVKECNWALIKNLKKLNSKYITTVFGLDRTDPVVNEAFLETETLSGGNIMEAILHDPSKVKVMHVVDCMIQIVEGLQHLHNKAHLVHTDLKAEYILVEKDRKNDGFFNVKISRLARCRTLFRGAVDHEGRVIDSTPVPDDSLRWAAAEVIHAPAFFSRASDVYSLALVFWQMLYALQVTDVPDFRCLVPHPEWPLVREIFHHNLLLDQHPEQPVHCPDWAYMLIKLCLRDRLKRPSLDYIRETLTSREPFKSELLESVKRQLYETPYKDNICFSESQPDTAPYLDAHPNTLPTRTQWYEQRFDEQPDFYLQGARFGYPNRERDSCCYRKSKMTDDVKYSSLGESDNNPYWSAYEEKGSHPSYINALAGQGFLNYEDLISDGNDELLYCEIPDHAVTSTSIPNYENVLTSPLNPSFDQYNYISSDDDEDEDDEDEEGKEGGDRRSREYSNSFTKLLQSKNQYINLSFGAEYTENPVYGVKPTGKRQRLCAINGQASQSTFREHDHIDTGIGLASVRNPAANETEGLETEMGGHSARISTHPEPIGVVEYARVDFDKKRRGHRRSKSETVNMTVCYSTIVHVEACKKKHRRSQSDDTAKITKDVQRCAKECENQISDEELKNKVERWLSQASRESTNTTASGGRTLGTAKAYENTDVRDEPSEKDYIYNDVLCAYSEPSMPVSYCEEKFVHIPVNSDDVYRLVTRNVLAEKH